MQDFSTDIIDLIDNKIDAFASEKSENTAQSEYKWEDNGLESNISAMAAKANNPAWRPIYSRKGWLGAVILFFKKAARKCLKFYIEPITNQQTEYNNVNQQVSSAMYGNLKMLSDHVQNFESIQNDRILDLETVLDSQARMIQTQELRFNSKVKENIDYKYQIDLENAERDRRLRNCEGKDTELLEKYENGERRLAVLEQEKESDKAFLKKQLDDIWSYLYQHSPARKLDNDGLFEKITTAQCGEDSIVIYILKVLGYEISKVRYLDLGANHAKFLSNTYALYSYGARGVLLEANPVLIPELEAERPGDVVVNKCLSVGNTGKMKFYVLNGDGLSSPDYESIKRAMELNPSLKIERTEEIEAITLEDLVKEYFLQAPDVVNIDIEGEEIRILKQIDFDTFRPLIYIIETIPYRPRLVFEEKNDELISFMKERDYIEYAFTGINSIFVDLRLLRGKFR